MKFISHRGNLNGPNSCHENSIEAIENALSLGYDCEIDVIGDPEDDMVDTYLYLGHDERQEKIDLSFLINKNLWIHCKNFDALRILHEFISVKKLNYFYHDKDRYTLTSCGDVWCYPGQPVPTNGVIVLPEKGPESLRFEGDNLNYISGICSDYIHFYRELFEGEKIYDY